MENLKRYGPCINKHGFATMQRIDNGGWVKFSDIKGLLQTAHNRQRDEIKPDCGNCLLSSQCTYYGFPSDSCGYVARV